MAEQPNSWLPFTLFSGLVTVIIVQFVGVTKIFGKLCDKIPLGEEYCIEKHEGNHTIFSKEQSVFGSYQYLSGLSTFIEFCALWALCSHIFICVKYCCVPVCFPCWRCCFGCGNGWYPVMIVGVVLNLAALLAMGFVFKSDDLFSYIDGFKYSLASFLLGILMVIIWAIYLFRNGLPPEGYFLGSDKVFSDYEVEVETERGWVETRYTDGSTTYKKYKMKHYRLVPKSSSGDIQETSGHI